MLKRINLRQCLFLTFLLCVFFGLFRRLFTDIPIDFTIDEETYGAILVPWYPILWLSGMEEGVLQMQSTGQKLRFISVLLLITSCLIETVVCVYLGVNIPIWICTTWKKLA